MTQPPNAWDSIFQREGRVFLQPQEDMPWVADTLRARGATTILDLGSGTGRHVLYFARQGFTVYGLDESPAGIALTEDWLAAEGISADLRAGNIFDRLPYDDAFFDAVVSIQVMHHGTIAAIRGLIEEMTRVLKPHGLIFVTVASLRNQATTFQEIEPGTLVPLDGKEAGLPHHFFTPEELRAVFDQYDDLEVHLDGTNHYCLAGAKR